MRYHFYEMLGRTLMRRRNSVLAATVVVTALVATSAVTAATASVASASDDRGRAKNVIYLLGDGMGAPLSPPPVSAITARPASSPWRGCLPRGM